MSETMKNIKHHLNDALLMAYSSGNLPEAFSLVVASHISMCDDCRARLDSFDAVGGSMLTNCDAAALDDGAFAATLALIDDAPEAAAAPRPAAKPGIFPVPLQDYVGGDLDAVKWRAIGGGVRQAILPTSKDATVRLLSIPSGTSMPDHGHRGIELTLVLQGAFSDENDRFSRGDIEIADQEMEHTPVAEGGEDCICLTAIDAPLKFNALLPRIMQPFLRNLRLRLRPLAPLKPVAFELGICPIVGIIRDGSVFRFGMRVPARRAARHGFGCRHPILIKRARKAARHRIASTRYRSVVHDCIGLKAASPPFAAGAHSFHRPASAAPIESSRGRKSDSAQHRFVP